MNAKQRRKKRRAVVWGVGLAAMVMPVQFISRLVARNMWPQ